MCIRDSSNVVGQLRADRDALDLFRAGFPAGTVTGTPKLRAMQFIDALEPVTRGFYSCLLYTSRCV